MVDEKLRRRTATRQPFAFLALTTATQRNYAASGDWRPRTLMVSAETDTSRPRAHETADFRGAGLRRYTTRGSGHTANRSGYASPACEAVPPLVSRLASAPTFDLPSARNAAGVALTGSLHPGPVALPPSAIPRRRQEDLLTRHSRARSTANGRRPTVRLTHLQQNPRRRWPALRSGQTAARFSRPFFSCEPP